MVCIFYCNLNVFLFYTSSFMHYKSTVLVIFLYSFLTLLFVYLAYCYNDRIYKIRFSSIYKYIW